MITNYTEILSNPIVEWYGAGWYAPYHEMVEITQWACLNIEMYDISPSNIIGARECSNQLVYGTHQYFKSIVEFDAYMEKSQ